MEGKALTISIEDGKIRIEGDGNFNSAELIGIFDVLRQREYQKLNFINPLNEKPE